MQILETVADAVSSRAAASSPVVLVPTMGALHRGHTALIEAAKKRAGSQGTIVVSIFVNPSQFGPHEDFSRYPRPLHEDLTICRELGVHAVFAPTVEAMYAADDSTVIEEQQVASGLCGQWRPGHFRGVCTVVAKLFQILRPDVAIFGEKDYQQLAVIRRMVRDLFFSVEILGHPTVREADGLALSSRNRYLTDEERRAAVHFPAALQATRELVAAGEIRAEALVARTREAIERETGGVVQYVELVDAESLVPLKILDRPAVLAAAVMMGKTRLIDNVRLEPIHADI